MLNNTLLPHNSLSCRDLTSAWGEKWSLNYPKVFLGNLLSLHPVTNGGRLQVGDQAYASTSKLCLEEAICYPRGIYHNITSPSKLFIWGSSGNKKHLLSYRLYLDCPSSNGSTCVTLCDVCACVFAFRCVHYPIAVAVWLFLLGRVIISMSLGCSVEIEMCFSSPQGNFSKALNGKTLLDVRTCVSVSMFPYLLFAVKGQFLWDNQSQTHSCLLSSLLCSRPLSAFHHPPRYDE